MATPEHTALEEVAAAVETGGFGAAVRTLAQVSWQRFKSGELGSMPVIVALAAAWIFFETREPTHTFLSAGNLSNLLQQIGVTGTIAIGIVLVLLLGEIDLSVGSVMILSSALVGWAVVHEGWAWYWAIVFALVSSTVIGALQGAWFAIIGVPSFVVTLAGLLAWQGVQQHVLGSEGTINIFDTHITAIRDTTLPYWWGWGVGIGVSGLYALSRFYEAVRRRRAGLPTVPLVVVGVRVGFVAIVTLLSVAVLNGGLKNFPNSTVFGAYDRGIPTIAVILVGLTIFFAWVTTRTRFGRYVFAVGGNAEATRRAGIDVRVVRIAVFALSGALAGIAGLLQTARLGASSLAINPGQVTLEAIAAAVIGGTSLFGGRGTIWSALLGALIIGSVGNGLDLMGQSPDIKLIVEGGILLAAITVDAIARRGRAAAGRA